MDLLLFGIYLVPFTLIGWIIFFFRLRKNKMGLLIYFTSFAIYLLLAAGFLIWAASETGWLAGIGPIMIGSVTLIGYSIIAFIVLALVRRSIKRSNTADQNE